jgi:hypothetical protein
MSPGSPGAGLAIIEKNADAHFFLSLLASSPRSDRSTMLAADRMLLESNMRQRAIQLREKEINLFTENFTAVGTQAAVLAGFTTTCFIEISIPEDSHVILVSLLHLSAIFTICANIICVSLSTIVSVWGSGKALRGLEGAMDAAADGMNDERALIFKAFDFGLAGNLLTVMIASWILMHPVVAVLATACITYSAWLIGSHAQRIKAKFSLDDYTTLTDLTRGDVFRMGKKRERRNSDEDATKSSHETNSNVQQHVFRAV